MSTDEKSYFLDEKGQHHILSGETMLDFDAVKEEAAVNIKVIGIGSAGCNIVAMFSQLQPQADFIYMNTDKQALQAIKGGGTKVQLGPQLCNGLAAVANPMIGAKAAEESREEILKAIIPSDMVLLVAGMGGVVGSGALPVIAEMACKNGMLCIPVVTIPFSFEGKQRMQRAQEAMERLERRCDAVVVIPNEGITTKRDNITGLREAFDKSDKNVLHAVSCLWEAAHGGGAFDVETTDFIASFQLGGGILHCGVGEAEGPERLREAFGFARNDALRQIGITRKNSSLLLFTSIEDNRKSALENEGYIEIPSSLRNKGNSLTRGGTCADKEQMTERNHSPDNRITQYGNCFVNEDDPCFASAQSKKERICLLHICSDGEARFSKMNNLLAKLADGNEQLCIETFQYMIDLSWENKAVVTLFIAQEY